MDFTSGYARPKSNIALADSKWAPAVHEDAPHYKVAEEQGLNTHRFATNENLKPWPAVHERNDPGLDNMQSRKDASQSRAARRASQRHSGATAYSNPNPKISLSDSKWSTDSTDERLDDVRPMEGIRHDYETSGSTTQNENPRSTVPWGDRPMTEACAFQSSTFMATSRQEWNKLQAARRELAQTKYEDVSPLRNKPVETSWSGFQSKKAPWDENVSPWGQKPVKTSLAEDQSKNTSWGQKPVKTSWPENPLSKSIMDENVSPWAQKAVKTSWTEDPSKNALWENTPVKASLPENQPSKAPGGKDVGSWEFKPVNTSWREHRSDSTSSGEDVKPCGNKPSKTSCPDKPFADAAWNRAPPTGGWATAASQNDSWGAGDLSKRQKGRDSWW